MYLIASNYVMLDEPHHYVAFTKRRNSIDNINRTTKHILLWNSLPGKMSSLLTLSDNNFFLHNGCELTDCHITSDRSNSKPIHSYDAVVYNMNVLHYSRELPWLVKNYSRSQNQRFVFFSQEPPM